MNETEKNSEAGSSEYHIVSMRLSNLIAVVISCAVLLALPSRAATIFLRGDANGDGPRRVGWGDDPAGALGGDRGRGAAR